jgi:hypothetical protein
LDVLVDESLDVKLAEHESLSCLVHAEESDVLMDFAFGILRLRSIRACALDPDELAIQYPLIFPP